ncbi:hypothetical protein Plhal304r1_c069g0157591 [Plasmopara halstedii]
MRLGDVKLCCEIWFSPVHPGTRDGKVLKKFGLNQITSRKLLIVRIPCTRLSIGT